MDPIIEALVTGASDDTIMEMLAEKEKDEVVQETEENEEEEEKQPKYKSCIKVRGRPILPPVMTEEVRRECREWKKRALEVEERLAQERRANIMEKVDRIVTRAIAAGHKVETEVQMDESLRLESGELSEEEDGEDDPMLGIKVEGESGDEDENSSSLQSVLRANSRLGEEVITGRTEEEETLTKDKEAEDKTNQGLSEGELIEDQTEEISEDVVEEISEEVTEDISEDTDVEEICEDILDEEPTKEENEGQESVVALVEEPGSKNAESVKEQVESSVKEEYNKEAFKDSDSNPELFDQEPTNITSGLPENSDDKQVPLSARSQISESISGPKSFEEIKKLVKSLPVTPKLPISLEDDKMKKDYEDDASSFISDDDDDDVTCAPSITTEVYEEWRYDLTGQQQELNKRPGITDSLLSVTTVVENPIFDKKATINRELLPGKSRTTTGNDDNKEEDQGEATSRPRRGSYSLDKPSPLLAAHMARLQSS